MADNEADNERSYATVVTRNSLIAIATSIIPMILVSAVILFQFRASYREKVYDHLGTLVKKHKQNVDRFLQERHRDLRFLAKTFTFEELSDDTFLQSRLTTLQQEFDGVFVDLGVVNAQGLQVAYAGPFMLAEARYAEADWFQEAMQQQDFISDVFLGLRGQPHFIVAYRGTWKGEPWILRATIDFFAFNNLVENIRIGETGLAFILNKNGEFQTKPRLEIVPEKEPYMELFRNSKQLQGGVSIRERSDSYGRTNIYAHSFLKDGDWLLVYQQDASDAFADLGETTKIALVILVLSAMIVVTVTAVLSRRMVGTLSQADREKELIHEQIVETGKLAAVGELAAGIAHEINNPVAIMVEEAGWIEDLLEEDEFQPSPNLKEFRRAVSQIRTQGRRCKEITHKLLSFARKTDSSVVQEVRVGELVEELVSLSAQRAKYGNVEIRTNIQAGLPAIRASQSELQQVFLNLINNALDAMEKEGGVLDISSRLEQGHVVVEVADNGPGIPRANLARIFDPFFTTKPVGKGTGLGLSICYGIIEKMGGTIRVESVVNERTSFAVHLPLGSSDQASAGVSRA